jgi:hypothetical protein
MRNARQERRLGLRRERARRSAWLREAILWPETTLLFGDGFWVRCVLRWWMPGLAIAGLAVALLSSEQAAFRAWSSLLAPMTLSDDPETDVLRHHVFAKELASARVAVATLIAMAAACGRMAAALYCDAEAGGRNS